MSDELEQYTKYDLLEQERINHYRSERLYGQIETGCSLDSRTVYITEGIDEDSYNKFLYGFKTLDASKGDINVMVCTGGGDTSFMFSMYDIITTANNKVITIGTGEVCSAGVLLLVCGNERFVTENCVLMSHGGSVFFDLNVDEAKARMKWLEWTEIQWAKLMARHTPRSSTHWISITRKEAELWHLGGKAIVEAGLADKVIERS